MYSIEHPCRPKASYRGLPLGFLGRSHCKATHKPRRPRGPVWRARTLRRGRNPAPPRRPPPSFPSGPDGAGLPAASVAAPQTTDRDLFSETLFGLPSLQLPFPFADGAGQWRTRQGSSDVVLRAARVVPRVRPLPHPPPRPLDAQVRRGLPGGLPGPRAARRLGTCSDAEGPEPCGDAPTGSGA